MKVLELMVLFLEWRTKKSSTDTFYCTIYTRKHIKVKRNPCELLAVSSFLGYTKSHMQYKIPIQIENEDVIVAWLSLRQLTIMMVWGWLGYAVFKSVETNLGPQVGLILAIPFVLIGVIVALLKIAEMTFLPTALNFFRLSLNAPSRTWSQGTDSYGDMEIWYVSLPTTKVQAEQNASLEWAMNADDAIQENILKL